jgi:hypothetical protein
LAHNRVSRQHKMSTRNSAKLVLLSNSFKKTLKINGKRISAQFILSGIKDGEFYFEISDIDFSKITNRFTIEQWENYLGISLKS